MQFQQKHSVGVSASQELTSFASRLTQANALWRLGLFPTNGCLALGAVWHLGLLECMAGKQLSTS